MDIIRHLLRRFKRGHSVLILLFCSLHLQAQNSPDDKSKISDNKDLAEFHLTMCLFFSDENQYDSAFWHAESAITLFRDLQDTLSLIDVYHELALIHLDIGIFEEAISYNQLALDLCLNASDTSKIIHHLKDFGVIYNNQKRYETGIQVTEEAFALARDYKSLPIPELTEVLNTLAKNHEGKQEMNKALEYFKMAHIAYLYPEPTWAYEDSIYASRTKNNLGNIYLELKNSTEARQWLFDAFKINQMLNDQLEMASNHRNLAKFYQGRTQYDSVEFYFAKAVNHAINSGSLEMLSEIYENIYSYHQFVGNFSTALEFQDNYLQVEDSIAKLKNKKATEAIEGRYQINKKQRQIEAQQLSILQKEAQLKVNLLIIVGLILSVVLIVVLFLFWRYRIKSRQDQILLEQEQKLKNQQSQAVISSLENERQRIARDIHDSIGQSVSALGLNLHALKNSSEEEKHQKTYENSQIILDNLHDEIRDIAFTLMPQKLEKSGFIEALKEMCNRINNSKTIEISLEIFDFEDLQNQTLSISLFRILQEVLSNIVKYANASKIDIQLIGHEDEMVILVEDDGIGFDINLFKNSKGNGWNNINYRINLISANIEYDTQPDRKGSSVTIEIPRK